MVRVPTIDEELISLQAYNAHISELKQAIVTKPTASNDPPTASILPKDGRPLSVYSDIPGISDFLTRPEFKLGTTLSWAFPCCTHPALSSILV